MKHTSYILLFLIVMLSTGVNIGHHLLTRMNISRNYLLLALVSITVALLLSHRKMLFVVLVSGLSLAINLSDETLARFNVNADILLATVLAIIFVPFIQNAIE